MIVLQIISDDDVVDFENHVIGLQSVSDAVAFVMGVWDGHFS